MGFAGRMGDRLIVPIAKRTPLLRRLAAFLHDRLAPTGTQAVKDRFIANGRNSRWSEATRKEIVERFAAIHDHFEVHSNQVDALIMTEALLSMPADGAMVECGCFLGGSTAKLSIVAALLETQLYVFDSFAGLPASASAEGGDFHGRHWRKFTWPAGANAATLEQVVENVKRFGDISRCTFVKGWFEDTLTSTNLPPHIRFAYSDVALPSSTRTVFTALWPRLTHGGVFFSRDVGFTKVLQQLMDRDLWRELDEFPPILFGAGYGLRDAASNLGFMVKGSVSAEYLNQLTIEKVTS